MSRGSRRGKSTKHSSIWAVILCLFLLMGCVGSLNKEETGADTDSVEQDYEEADDTEKTEDADDTDAEETENPESGSMTFPALAQDEQTDTKTSTKEQDETQELNVYYLDVGQGDSTLITCGDKAMLIDAGDNDRGTQIQNVLQKNGIDKLDYVIMTHPDADHIGGMDVILYKFDCETIFMTDYKKETETYRDVLDTMAEKGYKATAPAPGQTYELADASFEILAPNAVYEDANNNSIAILLTFGENKFLFTGDCEEAAETDIINNGMDIQADVYQVGHHGSRNASSQAFLNEVKPTYAVISCAADNSYGHPHAETLNKFRTMGVQVFRTDEQGTIIATSDGSSITFNCAPSDTWKAGEPTGSDALHGGQAELSSTETGAAAESATQAVATEQAAEAPAAGVTYVLNKNTMKFHLPSCSSVSDINPSNREDVTLTRDEIMAQGYVGCKRCNP